MPSLRENYRRLLERIEEASLRSGRDPDRVRLIGVTKTVATDRIREAVDCGLRDIGENRVQEAERKLSELDRTGVRCHLIGHLQSNKAGKAVRLFASIQSVDSPALADRLDRVAESELPVLIQVRLGEEETKSGVDLSALEVLARTIRASRHLRLEGLMGIPPYFDDPEAVRPFFRTLREKAAEFSLRELSMGMTHDFEVAIEEGATMVRIGTGLFRSRA